MLSRQLSVRARARMCQNLYSTYGATETATVALGHASVLEAVPGAVGYVQPGVLVEAIDKSGNILPPLRDGLLRIRTPNMASGYFGDPGDQPDVFSRRLFLLGRHRPHDARRPFGDYRPREDRVEYRRRYRESGIGRIGHHLVCRRGRGRRIRRQQRSRHCRNQRSDRGASAGRLVGRAAQPLCQPAGAVMRAGAFLRGRCAAARRTRQAGAPPTAGLGDSARQADMSGRPR